MPIHSKRSREGYLFIDHLFSPGISAEDAHKAGVPYAAPGGTIYESATVTCAVCCAIVVLNPDRSRPRNYHPATDRYICDSCAELVKNGFVASAEEAFDHAQEQAFRQEVGYNPLAPLNKDTPLFGSVGVK